MARKSHPQVEYAVGETKGWSRDDGVRAIQTNGDPVWEDDEGFEEAWEAQDLIFDEEGDD